MKNPAIAQRRFPAHDPHAIADFVRDQLSAGVLQIAVAVEAGDAVVSWPMGPSRAEAPA